ncbi:unnamed protein product [Mortierella alpina]
MSHSTKAKATMLPQYFGGDEFLKETIGNVPTYFYTTTISEWSLESYMLETGNDVTAFIEHLKCLSRAKRLPTALTNHAGALRRHYRGSFSVVKLRLAQANGERLITDHVLVAKKYLQVQRSVEQGLNEHIDPAVCKVSINAGRKHSYDTWADALTDLRKKRLSSENGSPAADTDTENTELELLRTELVDEKHPFFSLFQALFDIHHERSYVLPPVPANLSDLQRKLFRYVRSKLNRFKTLDRVSKKDVYVAASMVAHLEMDDAEDCFGCEVVQQLHTQIYDANFSKPDQWLVELLLEIKDETQDKRFGINVTRAKHIATWRLGLLSRDELDGKAVDNDLTCALEVIKLISRICEPPIVTKPKETEAMTVKVWHELFEVLFTGTIITIVIGESGLSASREEREYSEVDHGGAEPPLSPRKVDFVFKASVEHLRKVTHVELVDYEHKSSLATDEDVAVQLRKSMRHNQAILARLPRLEEVIFLDIRGYSAKVMKMVQHDGVHVCSEMSQEIVLPTNSFELRAFLQGNDLAALLKLRDAVLDAAMEVQQQLQRPKQPVLARAATPPKKPQVRTFYTPTCRKS